MRAVAADVEASVTRDGVTVHYARYGDASPTLVLLPTWSLVHSRHWKMQVPYLARHYTVLTFDGRGSGRSDRPASPGSYGAAEFAADALAVMDATETERAVLVSVSRGALWSLHLCAEHPNRVLGAIFIAPGVPFAPPPLERAVVLQRFDEVVEEPVGWEKYNAHHWKADYRDFVEFFVGQMLTEEHSTKQYEDAVHWALETDPATLIATNDGLDDCTPQAIGRLAAKVRCPVLVIQGSDDVVRAHAGGVSLAERTCGALVTLEGSGHFPHTRDPVRLNLLIRQFVEGTRR
jgi:pimeloyl-ACP methyl ester carboxylesterase